MTAPINLSNMDFNLLKVLDALIAERNVTRAGSRLGRSQPAVSNALQRLRLLLGDELLVRRPHGFVLTPRAEAIRQPLREAIALVEGCLAEETAFDPARAAGVFRLSTPDRLSLAVVPPLLARLQRLAPNMALQVLTADRKQALDLLDQDKTDLALVFCHGHPILRRGRAYIAAVLSFPQFGGERDRPTRRDFRRPVAAPRFSPPRAGCRDKFHRGAAPVERQRHDRRVHRTCGGGFSKIVQAGQTASADRCRENLHMPA